MSEEDKRIEKIAYNFKKLKEAHFWCQEHFKEGIEATQKDKETMGKLLIAIEEVYTELESLGVAKEFSAAVFIFGGVWINRFAQEFRNG